MKVLNAASEACLSDITATAADDPAAVFTKELVDDDEVIILLLKPSIWFVLLSSMGWLVCTALITFALAYMAKFMSQMPGIGWTDRQAFVLGIGLALLRVGWQFLEWLNRAYVLTDKRIIVRSGVMRVTIMQIPLKHIQHSSVFARLRERLLGLGTVGFAPTGSETYQIFWVMIHNPFAVHRTVVDAIRRYRG